MSEFVPVRLLESDLSRPVAEVPALDPATGRRSSRAIELVRLHSRPLGLVNLDIGDGINAAEHARRIWDALAQEIDEHLRADGLEPEPGPSASGLQSEGAPRCVQHQDEVLRKAPFISVVISTRDRPDVLKRAVGSLLAMDYPSFEVILVDNAPSTDATAQLFDREFRHLRGIRYVREDRAGLSRARNRGVAEAEGEIVAFTDDDVVVDSHWLSGLAEGFHRAPHAGCVTGLVLPMELDTQAQVWFEEFGGFGKGCRARIYDTGANRPDDVLFPYAAGKFGSGNNMAFRVDAVRAIGGFDPALGAGSPTFGGEDLAAFVAVLRKGYALVYEPAAIVHHQHRRDYVGLRKHIYDCGVGLTAFLTKSIVDDPRSLLEFAAKVPFGLRYALSSSSAKNRRKRENYPGELTDIERRGMLIGPLAYLRARWRASSRGDGAAVMTPVRPPAERRTDELRVG